jgi:hypothetical protein
MIQVIKFLFKFLAVLCTLGSLVLFFCDMKSEASVVSAFTVVLLWGYCLGLESELNRMKIWAGE